MTTARPKVAVCLSGHLRQVLRGFNLFNKNVIKANPDHDFEFYVDTWDEGEWRNADGLDETGGGLPLDTIEFVQKMIQPIAFRIERPIKWDTSKWHHLIKPGDVKKRTRGEHILGMYYKIQKCEELRESSSPRMDFYHHSHVIRWRSDLAIDEPIILNNIVPHYKKLYALRHHCNSDDWLLDVFAITSWDNLFGLKVYDAIHGGLPERHSVFRPEPLLKHHLNELKIDVEILETPWHILRNE